MYIAIEGADGSGKGTQVALIQQYLESKGKEIVMVREPGGTPYGEKIRELLLSDTHPCGLATLLAMFSDRAELLEKTVLPALDDNKWVISDRSLLSSWVYQYHIANVTTFSSMMNLTTMVHPFKRMLPYIIVLDSSPSVLKSRIMTRGDLNHYDEMVVEKAKEVNAGMLKLVHTCSNGYAIVNANGTPEEVHNRILEFVEKFL